MPKVYVFTYDRGADHPTRYISRAVVQQDGQPIQDAFKPVIEYEGYMRVKVRDAVVEWCRENGYEVIGS